MKKLLFTTFGIFTLLTLTTSCGKKTEEKKEEVAKETTVAAKDCVYSYHRDSTSVRWTAFKYTEKVGVSGKFEEFTVALDSAAKDPESILKSMEMTVYTSSVNSKNPERDKKIVNAFFGSLADSSSMTGVVKEVKGSDVVIAFTLNGVEKDFTGEYTIEDNVLKVKAMIDVSQWDALKGVEALNKVCSDLHTGTDGVSKLWPDVKLSLETKLRKVCN